MPCPVGRGRLGLETQESPKAKGICGRVSAGCVVTGPWPSIQLLTAYSSRLPYLEAGRW